MPHLEQPTALLFQPHSGQASSPMMAHVDMLVGQAGWEHQTLVREDEAQELLAEDAPDAFITYDRGDEEIALEVPALRLFMAAQALGIPSALISPKAALAKLVIPDTRDRFIYANYPLAAGQRLLGWMALLDGAAQK